MTTELKILLLTVAWTFVLLTPITLARLMTPNGVKWAIGNRDSDSRLPLWHDRAIKAHSNMIENLIPFSVIILVAQLAEVSNIWTIGGSVAFLIFRILHGVCYWFGLTPWRTHVFILSLVAEALIAYQIWRAL